ncbi:MULTISPECIES: hypothetical protein [Clostridium]|uniref:DUF6199 domain-containing protein n=1 Tax=Clostridium senegalense TaxID=1465809 RepID=A0A6M0H244_9CLOT|nr:MULTISPECIES: hypothetical protein [Clostridium]NEU04587.1 hypothetical protein [Clostridium senegalense]
MVELIIGFLCMVPIIGILIYNVVYPRESILYDNKWRFENFNFEPSKDAIKHHRCMSILVLGFTIFIMILLLFII